MKGRLSAPEQNQLSHYSPASGSFITGIVALGQITGTDAWLDRWVRTLPCVQQGLLSLLWAPTPTLCCPFEGWLNDRQPEEKQVRSVKGENQGDPKGKADKLSKLSQKQAHVHSPSARQDTEPDLLLNRQCPSPGEAQGSPGDVLIEVEKDDLN